MSNYTGKINLLMFKKAAIMNIKGATETKKSLVIPIEDNHFFVGEKGVYLDLNIRESREQKYDNTHFIVQNLPKEVYSTLTEEEKKQNPILGSMKPYGGGNLSENVPTAATVENPPF